jgi:hypothetical protein
MPTEIIYVHKTGKGHDHELIPGWFWDSEFEPVYLIHRDRADKGAESWLYRVELVGPRLARTKVIYHLIEQWESGHLPPTWELIAATAADDAPGTAAKECYTDAIDTMAKEAITNQLGIVKEMGGDPIMVVAAALRNHGLWEQRFHKGSS